MKRSPSSRTVLAHLLPKTSTQSLLLFYLAILKLQPRVTKTSRQGWRPSQRRSTSEIPASMTIVLRGHRPRFNLHLSRSSLSPFLLDSVRCDHHHNNPNISQPTHTHTVRTRGIISKTGEQPKTSQYP
jgi:hypothetical protein